MLACRATSSASYSHDFTHLRFCQFCYFAPTCDYAVLNLHHSRKHLCPPSRLPSVSNFSHLSPSRCPGFDFIARQRSRPLSREMRGMVWLAISSPRPLNGRQARSNAPPSIDLLLALYAPWDPTRRLATKPVTKICWQGATIHTLH